MRSRESGFTLIEIMIVMAIIVTLAGMVMMVVPYATERSKRVNCANNLSQLGKILVSEAATDRWPRAPGAGFLLTLYLENQEVRRDPKVFICPGDEECPYEPGGDEHKAKFAELDPKKVKEGEYDDYITSYAGRNQTDYPIKRDSEENQPIACDRNGLNQDMPYHSDGLNVLYQDGAVKFVEKTDLGLGPDQEIHMGDESAPPLLVPLVFRRY